MAQTMAVTVIGNDRPGIVAEVTRVLLARGCNLEDASSTILRGHFAMMLIVAVPDGTTPEDLEAELGEAAGGVGAGVTVRSVDEAAGRVEPPTHVVSVYGADKPGIVHGVAAELASLGANITALSSRVLGDQTSPVYALVMEVSAPGADLDTALGRLRETLGVDASVHPVDADVF